MSTILKLHKSKEGINNNVNISYSYVMYSEDIIDNIKTVNYLSFDGAGLDLVNESKEFGMNYGNGVVSGSGSDANNISPFEMTIESSNGASLTLNKGMALEFYDDCCAQFDIEVIDTEGNVTLTHTITVEDNIGLIPAINLGHPVYTAKLNNFVTNEPNELIKIISITFGGIGYITNLIEPNLLEEINILSDDLPISEFTCSVVISEDFPLSKGDKFSIVSNGTYYGDYYFIDKTHVSENIYEIKAQNHIAKLEDQEWYYSTNFEYSFTTIKTLPVEFPFVSSDFFGWIPINTFRYALCAMAFATGKMVDGNRTNVVKLIDIPQSTTSHITGDRIIGRAVLDVSGTIFKITRSYPIKSNQDRENESERILLHPDPGNPLNILTYKIKDAPAWVKGYGVDDIQVVFSNENVFEYYSTDIAPFEVSLTPIIFTMSSVECENLKDENVRIKDLSEFVVTAKDSAGNFITREADLQKYVNSRGTVKAKVRMRGEKPGDLVKIDTAWDGTITGIITSVNTSFGYEDIADIEVFEWN